MSKPPIRTVPSDDCVVKIDGKEYHVHEGEWVKIAGSSSVGELQAMWRFDEIAVNVEDAPQEGAPIADVRAYNRAVTSRLSDSFDNLCAAVAKRVIGWNWTDDLGNPIPQPDGTTEPMKSLRDDELYYLRSVIQGETASARKNGSNGSGAISSVKTRSRTKAS